MAEPGAVELLPPPVGGPVWSGHRPVRFGHVDPDGGVRLDAIAAIAQDVAGDDMTAGRLEDEVGWVVRRARFEVRRPAVFGEQLDVSTWCSGLGRRWAERRVRIVGDRGGSIEGVMIWVSLDPVSGRPVVLGPAFAEAYGHGGGREVSARLRHTTTADAGQDVARHAWAVRRTDVDRLGHVNNAAAWAMVEEHRGAVASTEPYQAEMEYRVAIGAHSALEIDVADGPGGGLRLWVRAAAHPPAEDPSAGADAPPVLHSTAADRPAALTGARWRPRVRAGRRTDRSTTRCRWPCRARRRRTAG